MTFANRYPLPAQYLRKAWFIILGDLRKRKSIYLKILKEDFKKAVYDEKAIEDAIKEFNVVGSSFDEKWDEFLFFTDEKESPTKKKYAIRYDKGYKIGHRHKHIICRCIALAMQRRLKSTDIRLPGKMKYPSLIQNQIHRHLSDVADMDKNPKFAKRTVPIGESNALSIVTYALQIAEQRKFSAEEKSVLKNIMLDIEALYKDNEKEQVKQQLNPDRSWERYHEFWSRPKDNVFVGQNSFWLQYERIDFPEEKRGYGLSVGAVLFENIGKKHLGCTFLKLNQNEGGPHIQVITQGLAAVDNNSWLHVELHNKRVASYPTLSKLTIRIGDVDKQELLFGHYNFYAFSRKKYLTKTVIWVKQKNDPNIRRSDSTIDTDYLFQNYVSIYDMQNQEYIDRVPKPIFSFLYSRQLNRLTMPGKSLLFINGKNSQSLENWVAEQGSKLPYDPTLEHLIGKYFVIYYFGKPLNDPKLTTRKIAGVSEKSLIDGLRFDTLDIRVDKLRKRFIGHFRHHSDITQKYSGEVTRKLTGIEVLLDDTGNDPDVSVQKDIILLTFAIPPISYEQKFKKEIEASTHFTGLISGLTDDDFRSVSYKALIIKREAVMEKDIVVRDGMEFQASFFVPFYKDLIIDFFKQNAGRLSVQTEAFRVQGKSGSSKTEKKK